MDRLKTHIETAEPYFDTLRMEMSTFWERKEKEEKKEAKQSAGFFSFFSTPEPVKKKETGIKMRSLKEYKDYEAMVNSHASKFSNIRSLYLFGSPGSGKTFMMDLFYDNLVIKRKRRVHFAEFMLKVHDDLHHLRLKAIF